MFDLEDLHDILDSIVAERTENNVMYKEEFTEMLLKMMDQYISENPKAISEPDFHEMFIGNIFDLVLSQFNQTIWSDDEEELEDIIEETADIFYESIMPRRSHSESVVLYPLSMTEKKKIKKQIDHLRSLPQPAQRTNDWYIFRHNLITASNAYKIFESETVQNQLIWEKCKPLSLAITDPEPDTDSSDAEENIKTIHISPNINTPMHWGQKYEPVSIMIYEDMYNTKVGEFGCIQHEKYKFLGASPDGINIDEKNPRFGRGVEIKNIVNREIDGIPKLEYWIQMQLQMETCNLNECDFLETKFSEYENETVYLEDTKTTQNRKGVIMYFSNPHLYVYAPLGLSKEQFDKWEEKKMEEHKDKVWIKNIYWRADIVSCVLVERNERWFQDNVKEMTRFWKIIEKERVEGSQHRAPNRKQKKEDTIGISGSPIAQGCLLNLNKETGKFVVVKKDDTPLKIRTESFDDSKLSM